MTTQRLPPNPRAFNSTDQWAMALYDYIVNSSPLYGKTDPAPIQLPHRVGGTTERATTDGILLYDATTKNVTVSRDNEWSGVVSSNDVLRIVYLASESAWLALTPKDPNTLYIWP